MPKKKDVFVYCSSPFSVYPNSPEPWSDVWIRVPKGRRHHGPPKDNFHFLGPCLEASGNIERQIEEAQESVTYWLSDRHKTDEILEHPLKMTDDELQVTIKAAQTNLDALLSAKNQFEAGADFVIWHDDGTGIPDCFIRAPYLTKSVVERALTHLMREKGIIGRTQPRFRWKRPKIFISSW